MELLLDRKLASGYKSTSQIARVMTENWVGKEIFCPSCGKAVDKYEHNRPLADFYCPRCGEDYELKSKAGKIGSKIVDGDFETAVKRTNSSSNPNLFLLAYDKNYNEVLNFFVIPKHFFTPQIIEKRKPLSQTARRAGWIGCNFVLDAIPQSGRIFYVKNTVVLPHKAVLESWQKTLFLKKELNAVQRGWTLDVMKCIEGLGKNEFLLTEVYALEKELEMKHPHNLHTRDKIRQQLQILRDSGYLEFLGRGRYRIS